LIERNFLRHASGSLPRCEFGIPRFPQKYKTIRIGLFLALFGVAVLLFLPALLIRSGAAGPAPVLLARPGSTRAIAFESVTQTIEPFAPTRALDFSLNGDRRTRVMLFATNLTLLAGDGPSAVTADGEDAAHVHYPMTVEHVSPVPGFAWMTAVVIRLHDNLGDAGDILVGLSYQGVAGNRVRVGIGHIGGGLPDDPAPSPTPTPAATPDLGPGASLHGQRAFPADNLWNQDISTMPVDPNSANLIASIGLSTGLHADFGTSLQRRAQRHSLRRSFRNSNTSADQPRDLWRRE
jgi:hypothetical protein